MGAFGAIETEEAGVRIREAATRGTLSHALLLTGSAQALPVAQYAAAAFQCESKGERPCGGCPACRKVLRNIHPDVITARDEEHKFLSADTVRALRSDAWIRPNEGRRKVYLFPDCGLLTERDQNILLKVVEEGPPYAAFVFCAENASAVLNTLRSRCVELKLPPENRDTDTFPEAAELGEALCYAAVRGKGAAAEWAVRLEKRRMDREDLARVLEWSREAFAAALFLTYGKPPEEPYRIIAPELAKAFSRKQLLSAMEHCEHYAAECPWNVGQGHILGALAVELEGLR